MGCILAEMLRNGRPLFPGNGQLDQAGLILELLGQPSHDVLDNWPGIARQWVLNKQAGGGNFDRIFPNHGQSAEVGSLTKIHFEGFLQKLSVRNSVRSIETHTKFASGLWHSVMGPMPLA